MHALDEFDGVDIVVGWVDSCTAYHVHILLSLEARDKGQRTVLAVDSAGTGCTLLRIGRECVRV